MGPAGCARLMDSSAETSPRRASREGHDVLRVEIHCHEIDHADAAVVISAEVERFALKSLAAVQSV